MEGGGANPGDDVVGLLVEGGLGPADVRARLLLLISATKFILGVTKIYTNLLGKKRRIYHTNHRNSPQVTWAKSERHLGPADVGAQLMLLFSGLRFRV